ncbi:MAG TPA: GNAT family N-acetyltransferase [Candidatus Saccharimonadales bacterium]|nr:GNAT family N-acetyltransferase [Candidatus Saccharimonadales bacterium]
MQDIIIRDTTADDLLALRTTHGQSWRDTYPNEAEGVSREWVEARTAGWITPEGIENSKEHVKDIYGHPNHLHKIAVEGDKVVGVVHVAKTPEKQHLHALYIAKEYYGSGLAQRLMEIGLAWADPHRPIDLQVATYNERAKAFYRKYGFEEVPGTEEKFAETIPVVTMERKGESA